MLFGNLQLDSPTRHIEVTLAFLLMATLLLSACQPTLDDPATIPGTESGAEESSTQAEEAVPTTPVEATEPLSAEDAADPVEISIPALALTLPVTPMGWTVVSTDDGLTTEWEVPEASLGWHPNTPGAGAAGNVLISGHQALGDGLLAPLALGEIMTGQELLLKDADGRIFVYRVGEVSAPIPLTGASEEELAQVDALVADGAGAKLTLITGWPEFTTTHRIFAQADLLGAASE
jgi:sortase (surface protein transpeptidase)